MREIRFRAWDTMQKLFIVITLPQGDINWNGQPEWKRDNLKPWQQYTGLQDVVGKDIYEGDIVDAATVQGGPLSNLKAPRKVVAWEEGRYNLNPKMKVIVRGNIYENPGLANE